MICRMGSLRKGEIIVFGPEEELCCPTQPLDG